MCVLVTCSLSYPDAIKANRLRIVGHTPRHSASSSVAMYVEPEEVADLDAEEETVAMCDPYGAEIPDVDTSNVGEYEGAVDAMSSKSDLAQYEDEDCMPNIMTDSFAEDLVVESEAADNEGYGAAHPCTYGSAWHVRQTAKYNALQGDFAKFTLSASSSP